MSTKRKSVAWQPLYRAERSPLHPKLAELARTDKAVADRLATHDEMWRNDRYTVTVYRRESDGTVDCLSIKRNDGGAVRDWRHMQQIKDELAGRDVEAIQLFPASDRLMDTANQTWLWCFPPGMRLPLGFSERATGGPEEAAEVGAHQREFEKGLAI